MLVPFAFLGLPSVQSIVEGIVNFFFVDVAQALVPSFLKNASVATIKWLVAVPDPTSWTHVGQLEGDMTMLAVSLLGVSFVSAIVRYTLVGLSGHGHPMQALSSTVVSAGLLIAYPWACRQTVAFLNTLTDTILSFHVVGEGLQRTVGVMFGGALLVGSGGVFLAILVIVGVVFAAVMFAMKVLILLAFALLYVTGPLLIALRPLPELSHLTRAWGTVLVGVAIVPVGWTILFAVAGALSLDATSFGAVGHAGLVGALTAHVAGAFAALLTFYLALRFPLGVLGHLRGALGGISGTGIGPAGQTSGGGGVSRVADANARLRGGTLAAGRSVGLAAGALGAPAGGPVGAATRAAGRLSGPLAAGAAGVAGGVLAGRVGKLGQRLSDSKPGQALARSPRAQAVTQSVKDRFGKAGRVLRDAPKEVRDAARDAVSSPRPAGNTASVSGARSPRSPQRQSGSRGDGSERIAVATDAATRQPRTTERQTRKGETTAGHGNDKSNRGPTGAAQAQKPRADTRVPGGGKSAGASAQRPPRPGSSPPGGSRRSAGTGQAQSGPPTQPKPGQQPPKEG